MSNKSAHGMDDTQMRVTRSCVWGDNQMSTHNDSDQGDIRHREGDIKMISNTVKSSTVKRY